MIRRFILAATIGFAATSLPAQDSDPRAIMRALGVEIDEAELAKAIERANAKPLGSKDNPVRAYRPEGQRAYLSRLRCADGSKPTFNRDGNIGTGPFGSIVDAYSVRCGGAAPLSVFMDMYHDHVEERPVDGFTIIPVAGIDPDNA